MIKSIRIKNFESHEDTFMEFGPGFNLIRGDSDSGKTSGVRAMAVVCFNRWEPSMLRIGCDTCEIEMVTDKGSVRVVKGTANSYYTSELQPDGSLVNQEFHAVNRTLPEPVPRITGMSVLDMGGIIDLPNFMFQLDQHYMLSQVNGVNCTDNMVARIVDNVIGLGGMEDLINDISSDGAAKKREYNLNSGMITDLKGKLHDPSMVVDLRKSVEKAKVILSDIEADRELEKSLVDCFMKFNGLLDKIANMRVAIAAKGDVNAMLAKLGVVSGLISRYDGINASMGKYHGLAASRDRCRSALAQMPDLLLVKKELSDVSLVMDNMKQLDSVRVSYEDAVYRRDSRNSMLSDVKRHEAEVLLEKQELMKQYPMCPLCGKPFSEDVHGKE